MNLFMQNANNNIKRQWLGAYWKEERLEATDSGSPLTWFDELENVSIGHRSNFSVAKDSDLIAKYRICQKC